MCCQIDEDVFLICLCFVCVCVAVCWALRATVVVTFFKLSSTTSNHTWVISREMITFFSTLAEKNIHCDREIWFSGSLILLSQRLKCVFCKDLKTTMLNRTHGSLLKVRNAFWTGIRLFRGPGSQQRTDAPRKSNCTRFSNPRFFFWWERPPLCPCRRSHCVVMHTNYNNVYDNYNDDDDT